MNPYIYDDRDTRELVREENFAMQERVEPPEEYKSCVMCRYSVGLVNPLKGRHMLYCHWLDVQLPPPVVEAIRRVVPDEPIAEQAATSCPVYVEEPL